MGKAHSSIAAQMKTELEEPLAAFAGGMKERRKIIQGGIEKLLKVKMQQTATVNKARDRYEQDCLKIKGFLAQAHMVMGQEERKNKAKLEKTQINMSTTSTEYEAAVKALEETTGRWNRDWKAACDVSSSRRCYEASANDVQQKFQDLEEERIDFTKSSLWSFANISSTVCVSDDAACEKIRLSLEDCDVGKDITAFIKDSGTGQEIPDPPKFIDFRRGDTTDTASEASGDGDFSVAQFQRTMNPTYRTSSPQPSMFESHHDPNNPLARELLGETTPVTLPVQQPAPSAQPPQPMQPVQPVQPLEPVQPVQSSRGVKPDPRLVQAQQQARQQYQQSQVPHNDYPMEGMTQFCRIPPPLEQRNSIPSPVRPSSRDSQSDYSNPTSFSSIEPPSGSASPGKPMAPPTPQDIDDRHNQKKKSSFFQHHSPFRRKSKHEKEELPAAITPSSRNTWTPTSRRANNENTSPTRSFGKAEQRSASPEPVDPRANFQLNIGNNVFDVASPDSRRQVKPQKEAQEELDPIAQALAELKTVTKQGSVRVSADRYHGLATPAPSATPSVDMRPTGGMPTPLTNANISAAQRGAAPPSYDQPPMSRLGAPQPAHTARQMQKTTQMYVDQKANMYNTNPSSRPATSTRGASTPNVARAPSPGPPRATSPRPGLYTAQQQPQSPAARRSASPNPYAASNAGGRQQQQQQQPASPAAYRAVSPNPYAASNAGGRPQQQQQAQSPAAYRAVSPNPYAASNAGGRPRAQTSSPIKPQYSTASRNSYSSSRGASPATHVPASVRAPSPQPAFANNTRPTSRAAPISRAASPQPQFRQSYDRPNSSRGSDMALQLAPGPGSERGGGSVYGGSQRGRGGNTQQRPQSSYYGGSEYGGGSGPAAANQSAPRERSKSLAEPRMYTKDGRMILHYGKYRY
jgi:hypothetical protein